MACGHDDSTINIVLLLLLFIIKDDVDGGDNWGYKMCKAVIKPSPSTTDNQLFTGRMPFMSPSQQCQSAEGKTSITFHRLVHPKLTWGPATLSVTTKGSGYRGGGLSCRFVSPLMPEIVRMKQMPDNISSHMEYEGAPPIGNANISLR